MNFSFGTPTTTTASTGGFSLGAPATSTAPATGFSFGTGTTPTFGASTGALAAPATLSLNPAAATSTAPAVGGLGSLSFGASLGGTGAATATAGALSGATGTAAAGASTLPAFGSLGTGISSLTGALASANANQPSGAAAANPLGAALATPATTTAAAPLSLGGGFGLGATATAAAAAKPVEQNILSLGATPATTTAAPTVAAVATTTNTSATTAGSAGQAASLTTNTQTTQSATVAGNQQLKFFQLEEFINKWTLELEEQEKLFTNQATQVNAWDNMLLANGEKIVALNEAVMKVKAEQNAMEQELEFITAQHTELEECIVPLEQELSRIGQIDLERGQTYSMAETLDSQLKQMYEDLKEVIEHLNDANKYTDPNDPLVQIGKILNAHMNSLQWIESSSTVITNRLEEVNKMHETLRKDNERSFRLTYYDQ